MNRELIVGVNKMNREAVARELLKLARDLVADADPAEIARAFKPKEVWDFFDARYISDYQLDRWEGLHTSIRGDTLSFEFIEMNDPEVAVYIKFKKPRASKRELAIPFDVKVTGDSNTYGFAKELGRSFKKPIVAKLGKSGNYLYVGREKWKVPVDDGNPTKTARFLEEELAELLNRRIEEILRDNW